MTGSDKAYACQQTQSQNMYLQYHQESLIVCHGNEQDMLYNIDNVATCCNKQPVVKMYG